MMTDVTLKNEERAIFALRELYRRYGYVPYKMSRFEEYDLYVRNKDFLVSDQIITFSGPSGQLLAMKPDVTLSIVKNAPEISGVVQKVYYNENVYRDYREILQTGLECVGDLSGYEIAEVVWLAAESLRLLGDSYVLSLSHMGLLDAVLSACGFTEGKKQKAMDALHRKDYQSLEAMSDGNPGTLRMLRCFTYSTSFCEWMSRLRCSMTTRRMEIALDELEQLYTFLVSKGFDESHIRVDSSISSDLGYYSGVVFRGYLEEIPTSILSGGQYDKLPQKMGRKARAIGFAVYVDLLHAREEHFDVDTLILHDDTVDIQTLSAEAEAAAKNGSVLVCRRPPKGRKWKKQLRFQNGKLCAQPEEDNAYGS